MGAICITEQIASLRYLNPCKLYCQRKGKSGYSILEDTVSDGVSCQTHHYEKAVCIDGNCIKVFVRIIC